MKDMTAEEAKVEAGRRWGPGGAIHQLEPTVSSRNGHPGRLRRYRFTVGNNRLGPACSVKGQGDTWREAFEDAARMDAARDWPALRSP
jgi:hypothetical protein